MLTPASTEHPENGWVSPVLGGAVGSTALVRTINERSLLDLLRSDGPTSRVELARTTGLSKPTVSAALANLLSYGLVDEAGSASGKPGPAAIIYRASAHIATVMSLDIGRSWIRVAIADLAGTLLVRQDIPNKARTSTALKASVVDLVNLAQRDATMTGRPQPTVCVVGGPGIPDASTETMRVASNVPGWSKRGFLAELRAVIAGTVLFENDVNLAAVGEHSHGAAVGLTDFILVSIGTGIGCGIVVRGELLRGATGAAGELGFVPIGGAARTIRDVGDAEATAVFEAQAAAEGIVRLATNAGLSQVVTAKDVFDLVLIGNKKAQIVASEVGDLIGRAMATLIVLFDPQTILVTGGVGENLEQLRPSIERAVRSFAPTVPMIQAGKLGSAASLYGGIATALPLARELTFVARSGS